MLYLADFDLGLADFGNWAVKTGHLETQPQQWSDVPTALAAKLWPGRKPMASAIQASRKATP